MSERESIGVPRSSAGERRPEEVPDADIQAWLALVRADFERNGFLGTNHTAWMFLAQTARREAAEIALSVRAQDVRALEEDVELLRRVVGPAISASVTVINDVARDKLMTAIEALPMRLRVRR